ncbi:hypothetical protein BV898_11051 [Hypsibius exemplaris]|uniref:Uncharacterized protein n=1 Tax=Hypsibius exemplaris TaxID=2072580 RepID=A0A1W0WHV3_HYPEX|nr:hypothetical protein BV898_11051 [Hypsibius exemplaris]
MLRRIELNYVPAYSKSHTTDPNHEDHDQLPPASRSRLLLNVTCERLSSVERERRGVLGLGGAVMPVVVIVYLSAGLLLGTFDMVLFRWRLSVAMSQTAMESEEGGESMLSHYGQSSFR